MAKATAACTCCECGKSLFSASCTNDSLTIFFVFSIIYLFLPVYSIAQVLYFFHNCRKEISGNRNRIKRLFLYLVSDVTLLFCALDHQSAGVIFAPFGFDSFLCRPLCITPQSAACGVLGAGFMVYPAFPLSDHLSPVLTRAKASPFLTLHLYTAGRSAVLYNVHLHPPFLFNFNFKVLFLLVCHPPNYRQANRNLL